MVKSVSAPEIITPPSIPLSTQLLHSTPEIISPPILGTPVLSATTDIMIHATSTPEISTPIPKAPPPIPKGSIVQKTNIPSEVKKLKKKITDVNKNKPAKDIRPAFDISQISSAAATLRQVERKNDTLQAQNLNTPLLALKQNPKFLKMQKIILFSVLLVIFVGQSQSQRNITILKGFTCNANEETVVLSTSSNIQDLGSVSPVPDLNNYDGGSISVGTWVIYREPFYFGNGFLARDQCVQHAWHEKYPIQSFRYAGDLEDVDKPTVNMYEDLWYNGRERPVYQKDEPILNPDNFQSLILSGNSPITLYTLAFYAGNDALCLYPSHGVTGVTDTERLWPLNFPIPKRARSMKFGCFSENIYKN